MKSLTSSPLRFYSYTRIYIFSIVFTSIVTVAQIQYFVNKTSIDISPLISYVSKYPNNEILNALLFESISLYEEETGHLNQTILGDCMPTTQVRITKEVNQAWFLQTYDINGNAKIEGGDEFYITFHENRTYINPTAVALITDNRDGTYELDFVSTPMPPSAGNVCHERNSTNSPTNSCDSRSSHKNVLTIHLSFTCDIGNIVPPQKENWTDGGYIIRTYESPDIEPPSIRDFTPPNKDFLTVDLSQYDHTIFYGDSNLEHFVGHHYFNHHNHFFRPESIKNFKPRKGSPLDSKNLRRFHKGPWWFFQKYIKSKDALDIANNKVMIVLNAGTWELLDTTGIQDAKFSNHIEACKTVIKELKEKIKEWKKADPNTTISLAWKSPVAHHLHILESGLRSKQIPEDGIKRIKYMSSTRSKTLHSLQKDLMKSFNIPLLDIYDATYLSAAWHRPLDSRHYRPQLNEMMLNWFYSKPIHYGEHDRVQDSDYSLAGEGKRYEKYDKYYLNTGRRLSTQISV